MKKFLLSFALLALALGFVPTPSRANDDPDSNKWKLTTVQWIHDNNQHNTQNDDKYVVLIGKVVNQIDEDTYEFEDGTGRIQLDCEQKLPQGKSIVVRGEIDQAYWDIGEIEMNVSSWRYDKKR